MLGPGAHIAGFPVEETLTTMSPALTVGVGVLALAFRERLGRLPRRCRDLFTVLQGRKREPQ
jgi:hypothetical protein